MEHNTKPYMLIVAWGKMKYIHKEVDEADLETEVDNLRALLTRRWEERRMKRKGGHHPEIFIYLQAHTPSIILRAKK